MSLEPFVSDARRAARGLLRTPSFTLAALVTLALGIGAVSAIFTVVNAVLLKPLPYAQTEQRVLIYSRWVGFDKTWLSGAEGLDYARYVRSFAGVCLWNTGAANLTGDGDPIRVGAGAITANTFDVLGASPLFGRPFTALEDRPGHDNVAVLSYGLWQSRYAGDPGILNRTVQVNGTARTIVAVMPAGFRLPTDYGEDATEPTQLWLPLALDVEQVAQTRGNHGLFGAALLRPGETPASASAELSALAATWTREGLYPPAMKFTAFAVGLDEEILGPVRPAVWLLAGAVAFLLLIACANVASLILARAEGRHRELALRCALGAGHWRLVRQLLTEGVVLAVASGALGLLLAIAGVRILLAVDPTVVPRADTIGVDWRVLTFTALTSILTTFVFSAAPAVRAFRLDLNDALKEGTHQSTTGAARTRLRGLLVVVEVALAVVLAIGAVLMVRSLWALQRIDLGFDPSHVLTARVTVPPAGYPEPAQVVSFYERLLARVRALPGVTSAGAVRALPLADTIGDFGLDIEGYAEPPGQNAKGDWQIVTDGAAETLRERLVRGRFIATTDTTDAQPVIVINETMARLYWAGRDPIGGRVRIGSNPTRPWLTVVGIVADQKHNGIEGLVKEKFYVAAPAMAQGDDILRALDDAADQDGRRSDEPGGRRARRRPRARRVAAGRQRADARRRGGDVDCDHALCRLADGPVCGAGGRALGSRPLRRPGVPRVAAAARDWHPHGARRAGGARHPPGGGARAASGAGGRRRRAHRRVVSHAARAGPAAGGAADQSGDLRGSGAPARRRRGAGQLRARPPGDARGPVDCPARGLGSEFTCVDNRARQSGAGLQPGQRGPEQA